MLGRKRKLSSDVGGCPPQGGTPQSSVPRAQRREAGPGRSNISPRATSAIDIDSLIDGMQRMAIGPACHAVEPKRVCLPGSSQSSQVGGCPPWTGTPQSSSAQGQRGKKHHRRRRRRQRRRRRRRNNSFTPHATTAISLDSLIAAMQRLAISPPKTGLEPQPVCLPGSSPSSKADGCPPWRGTGHRRFLRQAKMKMPHGSLRKMKEQRRKRNIPSRTMRAMARTHMTDVIQCSAVGTQDSSTVRQHVHLLGHGVRPRPASPPKANIKPMEVHVPEHGKGTMAVYPPSSSMESMEVDPPQEQPCMALGPPARGMTYHFPSHSGSVMQGGAKQRRRNARPAPYRRPGRRSFVMGE